MSTINSDKAWNKFGKKNPYFGVLTYDEFLDENLSEESKKKFFKTGEEFAERIFTSIHKRLDSSFSPKKILDFGCGTGRLTLALAKRGEETVGMDVSVDMLEEAKKNAIDQAISSVTFLPSDDELSAIAGRKFDLINCYIVLQHINVERGLKIFSTLVDALDNKGIGVIQFTYRSNKSKIKKVFSYFRYRLPFLHGIMNLVKGSSYREPLMQMNSYNLNQIYSILQEKGIDSTFQKLEDHGGFWGVTIYFQK